MTLIALLLVWVPHGTAEQRVQLIYISAWDCVYCKQWERFVQPEWEATLERRAVDFRVVKANYANVIDEDRYWPQDLRWVRDALRIRRGTPRYIVIADGKVLLHRFGTGAWATAVYPLVQRLVAERMANER